MLDVAMASRSDTGERSRNEDDIRFGRGDALWFAILSDGAGGHLNGAMASEIVVRTVAGELQSARPLATYHLRFALERANAALNSQQRGAKSHQRMHATAVSLWIDPETHQALWAHVGDSRLYVSRHGQVRQLTRDDSVVQQMIDAGLLAAQDARSHPRKNQLLSALGAEETIDIHTLEQPFTLRDGDAFLLCSDGWWDVLEPGDIERTLAHAYDVNDWLDAMMALVRQRHRPNQDNYSAIGVWVGDPSQSTQVGPL